MAIRIDGDAGIGVASWRDAGCVVTDNRVIWIGVIGIDRRYRCDTGYAAAANYMQLSTRILLDTLNIKIPRAVRADVVDGSYAGACPAATSR
jgi:hypothetical protein